jgi:DNA-binding MarR family transcriptional regulator
MGDDAHDDLRLWLRLFASSNLIAGELRARLQAEFGISLARFDLLAQLERAPDGLTMSLLSRRLMVTNAAVTGVTNALVEEGFVERLDDAADRRRAILRLTPAGRESFLKMAARHESWVRDLMQPLEASEKTALESLLRKLRRSLIERIGG